MSQPIFGNADNNIVVAINNCPGPLVRTDCVAALSVLIFNG